MRGPFPGMDPYLERTWGDLHGSLIVYAHNQIDDQLPPDLRARTQSIVMAEAEPRAGRLPDVLVTELPFDPRSRLSGGIATAVPNTVAEPWLLEVPFPIETVENYIEILHAGSRERLVTVVEVLSPKNKSRGDGLEAVRQKRTELLSAGVNLVEIDLLRAGVRDFGIPDASVDRPPPPTAYAACIRRAERRTRAEFYPLPLRHSLPKLAIPLRPTDLDVVLDLQAVFELAYRKGRYFYTDYTATPEPPLAPEDAAWAAGLIAAWNQAQLAGAVAP